MADSLQISYDGGRTIDESVLAEPIQISNGAAAVAALMQMTATANAVALAITQSTAQNAITATMDATAEGYAGLAVEGSSLNHLLVSLHDSVNDVVSYLYGKGAIWGSGCDATMLPNVIIATGETAPPTTSPGLQINTGRSEDGGGAGPISVGFDVDGNIDGGFYLSGTTGRMELRTHQVGTSEGDPIIAGTLRLHNITGEQEGEITAFDGDVHYRNTQEPSSNDQLSKGFRAYRDGAFALVGRGYQLPFDNDDLTGGDPPNQLNVSHGLDTVAPLVCLYDNNGTVVPPGPTTWTGYYGTSNTYTVELDASQVPLAGPWTITLMGF